MVWQEVMRASSRQGRKGMEKLVMLWDVDVGERGRQRMLPASLEGMLLRGVGTEARCWVPLKVLGR